MNDMLSNLHQLNNRNDPLFDFTLGLGYCLVPTETLVGFEKEHP